MARPSTFTSEIATAICDRMAAGESLRAICRDEAMPSRTTVLRWLDTDEEFRGQYVRARDAQADHLADEILEIADDGSNDWMERARRDGTIETVLNDEHVRRSALRVDARKWLLAKMAPKKYGDRVAQEVSGPDGGPIRVSDASDLEIARRLAYIFATAGRKTDEQS